MPLVGLTLVSLVSARAGLKHVHPARDLTPAGSFSGWNYVGCYTDSPAARGLNMGGYNDDQMTDAKCIEYCDQAGYGRAGVEYWRECYCGYEVDAPSTLANDSNCNFPCPGNSDEPCGGSGYMNVFSNGVAPPAEAPGPSGWEALGCYTDNVSARTLTTNVSPSDEIVTVYSCTTLCSQQGFQYAGVEYARECYCGNEISNGGAPASSGCDMACTGDHTEICGGANRLNLYQTTTSN